MPKMSMEMRFLCKAQISADDGCWEWAAYRNKDGYGTFKSGRSTSGAHRVSYEIYFGAVPEGAQVLHRCDNPGCVNPDHLFLGTQADNMADKVAKGRQARGASHARPNAKLTESDVVAIRAANGISQRKLGDRFGVGQHQISRIRAGKAWSYLS